ncbi:MAG: phosphate signaling complex protein PhoU [Geodermatophilaceae bacterium]|nr:phosphate signaling complex protein PhoU [Geodermatophilaceae bacterium]
MRASFQAELDRIGDQLVVMTNHVELAMSRATTALLDADYTLASWVIDTDREIDELKAGVDDACFQLLARQAPVATDLRVVVTALSMAADLERMGDLSAHVAKVARMRFPESAVPPELRPTILEMGEAAQAIVAKTGSVIAGRDLERAKELEADDDIVDRLHKDLFLTLLADTWTHGIEPAIDMTLLGRYYERFADHGVRVARQVVYVVTGVMPTRDAEAWGEA